MTDDLFSTSIPGNLAEGETVQEFTIQAAPKQFLTPAASLNYSLFLGAVKDAREFHSALMKYKRLNWTKAAATARGTRNTYLRRARRYLDRVLDACIEEPVVEHYAASELVKAYRSALPRDKE